MANPPGSKSKKDWGLTDYYFIDLVVMLASSARIDLGDLVHPYYKDKTENLPRARTTINMLVSLAKKTMGNLNVEERKVLREVLDDLQKTYVEKANLGRPREAKPGAGGGEVRPLVPSTAIPRPDVKEWIRLAQQEIARRKQNPPKK